MKSLRRLTASFLLLACALAATSDVPRLAELVRAQSSAVSKTRAQTPMRAPRVAVQLDDIIKKHDQMTTGDLKEKDLLDGLTKVVDAPLKEKNVEKFLRTHRPVMDLQGSSSIRTGSNPDFYVQLQDQMEPLENDYKLILENFKKIGCFENEDKNQGIEALLTDPTSGELANRTVEMNPYSLCDGDLAGQLFLPLADVNSHGSQVFEHFNQHVYQPLSYKVYPNRFSFADTLQDMLNLDKDNLMIKGDMPIPDFPKFQSMILGGFAEIANYASDFDANKQLISKLILDILKHFHIYWNVKRQQNQVDTTKINTYSILQAIVKRYREQNTAMKATTIHILNSIRDAYFRFIRAHKMQALFASHPIDVLSFNFLKRYDRFVQSILEGKWYRDTVVYELSVFVEYFTTHVSLSLNTGLKDVDAFQLFHETVYVKVIDMYNVYAKWMVETNNQYFDKVTEATASILLKIKQREALLLSQLSIPGIGQISPSTFRSKSNSHIKTFYEIMDYWMLVPTQCVNYPRLEGCTKGFGLGALFKLRIKNSLNLAVSGMNFYRFLKNSFEQLIDSIAEKNGYANYETFKNLYFAELFKISENIKIMYRLNDMSTVDKLQNRIGQVVEKEKAGTGMTPDLLQILTHFDDQLYDFFLDMRDQFNGAGNIDKNPSVLNQIRDKFNDFVDEFENKNLRADDHLVQTVFPTLRKIASDWAQASLNEFVDDIRDSVAWTPGSQYTPLPAKDSIAIENIIREPQIDSGAVAPVYMGMPEPGKRKKMVR